MTKKFAFALLLMIQAGSLFAQADDASEKYGKGLQLYFSGYYQLAIASFDDALKQNPKMYEAYLYRGKCSAYLHQFKAAEKDFKTAAPHLKNSAELEFGFGYLYNEMGEYKKAIRYLNQTLRIDPKNALAYNALGVSYLGLHNARTAIDNYTMAIKLDSNFALAYNNRGTAIYENQDVEAATSFDIRSAIKDLDHAIKIDPHLCIALRNRGLAYSFLHQNELALENLDSAIRCENNNADFYLNRGIVHTSLKHYQKAIDDINYSLQLDPKQPEAFIALGEAYAGAGYTQEAVVDEMKAKIMDKNFAGLAYYNIARYYCKTKDKDLMMKYLELAKKSDYFKPIDHLAGFLKNDEFSGYKKDEDFNKFRQSVRKNRM